MPTTLTTAQLGMYRDRITAGGLTEAIKVYSELYDLGVQLRRLGQRRSHWQYCYRRIGFGFSEQHSHAGFGFECLQKSHACAD